jgi:hypothetical protein
LDIKAETEKPRAVLYAEWALWAWTAWACLFGIYQSWIAIPAIEDAITGQLQGMVTLEPKTLLQAIIAGYGAMAVLSVWVVLKIGAGKNWARSSLLWGFVLEAAIAAWPPYHGLLDTLADVPDFGLQGYALYLLYTKPGRDWFHRPAG